MVKEVGGCCGGVVEREGGREGGVKRGTVGGRVRVVGSLDELKCSA